ncbi:hypothetical protein [Hymenobacter guriensis]|uniref:Lipoprotein n=1 Tax=Hymenobacter guriensis TaxID=2793065 RepID=A0ABS0L5U4_9BACT|nr:hypothetical protein [Hymenobacter guriensis]MBG8555496.1 hypothetical protein [Hymenobacter guriensis]
MKKINTTKIKTKIFNKSALICIILSLTSCFHGQGIHKANFCINKKDIKLNINKLSSLKSNIKLLSQVSNTHKSISSYCFIKKGENNNELHLIKATEFPHGIPFYFINTKNKLHIINVYDIETKDQMINRIDSIFQNNTITNDTTLKNNIKKYFYHEYFGL